jgi:hypothetical protein
MTIRFLFRGIFPSLLFFGWPFFLNAKVFSSPASALDFRCIALLMGSFLHGVLEFSAFLLIFFLFCFLFFFVFNFHTMQSTYLVGRGQGMRRR